MAATHTSDDKFLAPCIVAALLWLALVFYLFAVVPIQSDLAVQHAKSDQMRASFPQLTQFILHFHAAHGTAFTALAGALGCGFAYARRSAKWANAMILLGSAVTLLLIVSLLKQI